MTDGQANAWFTETPAGQPGNVSPAAPVEPASTNPTQPTQTAPAEDVDPRTARAIEDLRRRMQADADKRQSTLKAEIERLSKLVEKTPGAPPATEPTPTPSAAQNSGAASTSQPGQAEPAGARQPSVVTPPQTQGRIDFANQVLQEEGTMLAPGDPEAVKLMEVIRSGADYRAVEAAARQAAAARKERAGTEARVQTPTAGGGSLPGNSLKNVRDLNELYKRGMKQESMKRR
jgi:hypothetical protein